VIVPARRGLIVVIGRDGGAFLDNCKYMYLSLVRKREVQTVFVTERRQVFEGLAGRGLPVVHYPGWRGCWTLLRAQILIVDNLDWVSNFKYHLLWKSYKVQLWHGVGFKRIELDNPAEQRKTASVLARFVAWSLGRFPRYELLISTSPFYTRHVFSRAFHWTEILESGYPRTDVFAQSFEYEELEVDMAALDTIRQCRARGSRVVVYMPTFRESAGGSLFRDHLDLDRLARFARDHALVFVLKFHPRFPVSVRLDSGTPILIYDHDKDIYPLLSLTNLLITDYSSIYMDYLLLDKPVVFFPFDYEQYIARDRQIQFDYDWITPGPKCQTQEDLEIEIIRKLDGLEDAETVRRAEIRNLAFIHPAGGACERIWMQGLANRICQARRF